MEGRPIADASVALARIVRPVEAMNCEFAGTGCGFSQTARVKECETIQRHRSGDSRNPDLQLGEFRGRR